MVTDELYCWCGDPGVGTVVMLLLPGAAAAAGRDCLYKFLLPAAAALLLGPPWPRRSLPPRRGGMASCLGAGWRHLATRQRSSE